MTYNTTALVDDAGTVTERYQYDPYGQVTVMDDNYVPRGNKSAHGNELTFTSRRLDSATSLMYFRARYYDPETEEFISRDPLEYVFGDPPKAPNKNF